MSDAEVRGWLDAFSAAVRARDYEAGLALVSEEIVGFGTVVHASRGAAQLRSQQWSFVWDRTEGFDFDGAGAEVWCGEALASVAARWSSHGIDGNGERFERHGRATIVLRRGDDGLRAVHTHFSKIPPDAPTL